MSIDPKTDFYLANRSAIEEWAALRPPVAAALDRALLDSALSADLDDATAPFQVSEERTRYVWLPIVKSVACVQLSWEASKLLAGSGTGGWVKLIVWVAPTQPKSVRDAVKDASVNSGFTMTDFSTSWVRYGPIVPDSEPIDLDGYVAQCLLVLRGAWLALNGPVRDALAAAGVGSPETLPQ